MVLLIEDVMRGREDGVLGDEHSAARSRPLVFVEKGYGHKGAMMNLSELLFLDTEGLLVVKYTLLRVGKLTIF